jgi:hypothetical protein
MSSKFKKNVSLLATAVNNTWHGLGRREMHSGFWGKNLSLHGRPRCIWEDNIKMDLKEVGW